MSTMSAGSTRFVQPIALQRSGSHEDAVTAVALASVLAFVHSAQEPAWALWLSGQFAKSVRRAKPSQFAALAPTAQAVTTVGDAKAAAFLPATYEDLDPALAKLQVSGTEFDRSGRWHPCEQQGGPRVLVNEDLGMSTGKTAAQAAHGLFVWYLEADDSTKASWVAQGTPFTVHGIDNAEFTTLARTAPVTINDAGFTEIAPGSATVIVL